MKSEICITLEAPEDTSYLAFEELSKRLLNWMEEFDLAIESGESEEEY